MSKRSQVALSESTASRRDKALKFPNHLRIKKLQSPSLIPEEDRGNHAPSNDQVEKHLPKSLQKHPMCTCILDRRIPKPMENPYKLSEYNWKRD